MLLTIVLLRTGTGFLLLWGRNRDIPDGLVFNSYLAESMFGYDHEFHFVPHVSSTFGKQYMLYTKLRFLNAIYGET